MTNNTNPVRRTATAAAADRLGRYGIIAAAAAVGLAFVDGQLVIPAAITATATVTEAPAKWEKVNV